MAELRQGKCLHCNCSYFTLEPTVGDKGPATNKRLILIHNRMFCHKCKDDLRCVDGLSLLATVLGLAIDNGMVESRG